MGSCGLHDRLRIASTVLHRVFIRTNFDTHQCHHKYDLQIFLTEKFVGFHRPKIGRHYIFCLLRLGVGYDSTV